MSITYIVFMKKEKYKYHNVFILLIPGTVNDLHNLTVPTNAQYH